MLRGPTVRILGIPVRFEIWFMIIVGITPLSRLRTPLYFLELVAVLLVVLTFHEVAKALIMRRRGAEPSVVMWGFGGITYAGVPQEPRSRITAQLGGSAIAFAILGVPSFLLLDWAYSFGTNPYLSQTVIDTWVIAAGWTLVSLLPIRPLDGGQVAEAIYEMRTGDVQRQTVRMISVVFGVLLTLWSLFAGGPWALCLFLGIFLALGNGLEYWSERTNRALPIAFIPADESSGMESYETANVTSMRAARKKRDRRSAGELLLDGYMAVERRDYQGALRLVRRLEGKRLSAEQQRQAVELAVWAHLGTGDPGAAQLALADLPDSASPSPPLSAALALAQRRNEDAVRLLVDILVHQADSPATMVAVDYFAERGMIHRLARDLVDLKDGSGFEAAVQLEGMLHRLHRTEDASTVSDVILLG